MMEIAILGGIVLIASAGFFRSFQRSRTDKKIACLCAHGCSCATAGCSGDDLSGNPDDRDSTFDVAEHGTPFNGKVRPGHFRT